MRLTAASFIILVLTLGVSPFMVPAVGVQGPFNSSLAQAPSQSPCLPPSPADVSNATIQAASVGSQVPDFVPSSAMAQSSPVSPMPQSFMLHMEFVFAIRNPVSFQACLNAIQDPNSAHYHQFLNALTLEPYAPTPAQKSSVISYFEGKGLTAKAGQFPLVLDVTGSVASVQSAFSTSIKMFGGGGGHNFYAPATYPWMPSNFAAMGMAIEGMDNYSRAVPMESPCSGPYCPQGIQVGYSLSSLLSGGHTGAGVSVAVIDEPGDPNIQGAINTFDTQYGLPATTLTIKEPDGTPSSWNAGWASEAAMDVEALHTTAPGANIVVVYGNGADDPMSLVDSVATSHEASIVSNSWGYGCGSVSCSDTQLSSALVSSTDSRLAIDAAQGLTILFASGDQGATPDGATFGVEFPASDVNVLAVGATNLALSGCGTTTCSGYSSESGASIGGGGYSGYFPEPSWQSAAKPSLSGRGVPDVSMLGYAPNFWVYSTLSDKCGTASPAAGWFGCAGTSLATPLWAGVTAIVEQVKGGGLMGNIAPSIWNLANSPSYSSDFHDVTTGNNNDGAGGYSATTGWDPSTGWGSPVASALVPDFTSTTTTASSTTTASVTTTLTTTILVTTTATSTIVKTASTTSTTSVTSASTFTVPTTTTSTSTSTSTSTIRRTTSTTSTTTNVLTTTVGSTSTTYTPVSTATVSSTVTTTTPATATTTLTTTTPTTATSTSTSYTTLTTTLPATATSTTTIPATVTSTTTIIAPTTTTSTNTIVASTTATHTTTLSTTISAPTTSTVTSTSYTTLTSTIPATTTSTTTVPATTTSTSTGTVATSTTATHTTTSTITIPATTTSTGTATASTTTTSTIYTTLTSTLPATTTSTTTLPATTVSTATIPATTTSTITVPTTITATSTSTAATTTTTTHVTTSTITIPTSTTSTNTVAASTTSTYTNTITTPTTATSTSTSYTTLTTTVSTTATTTSTNTVATSITSARTITLTTTITTSTATTATGTVTTSTTTTHTSILSTTTTAPATTTSTSTSHTTLITTLPATTVSTATIPATTTSTVTVRTTVTVTTTVTTSILSTSRSTSVTISSTTSWLTTTRTITHTCSNGFC